MGIFPYVLKLLQSPAVELREILVFIWAKILALDKLRVAGIDQELLTYAIYSVLSIGSDQGRWTTLLY